LEEAFIDLAVAIVILVIAGFKLWGDLACACAPLTIVTGFFALAASAA
jgi:hypothetical protein